MTPSGSQTIPLKVADDGRELSNDALGHLRMILLHRRDIEVLRVEIFPARCALCDEILQWAVAATSEPER